MHICKFCTIIFLKKQFFYAIYIKQAPLARRLLDFLGFNISISRYVDISIFRNFVMSIILLLLQHKLLAVLDDDALVVDIYLLAHDVVHRFAQVEASLGEYLLNAFPWND